MNIVIHSVDDAPDDLPGQTPIRARLVRRLEGTDRRGRDSYWLAELRTPISWTREGVTREIHHLLVVARWQGTSIEPGARLLPVNVLYITDDAILSSEVLNLDHAEYVATGTAKVTESLSFRERLRRLLP